MKKIKIIENCGQNEARMSMAELAKAITSSKKMVVAKNEAGSLFVIVKRDNRYVFMDKNGAACFCYIHLSNLVNDFELFLVE